MKEFVHLHTHTEYSLLDGANKIEHLAKTAKLNGQKSLAITDHGNMFGALEHYIECNKHDVKPIIGCEVYVSKETHLNKHTRKNGYNHLTLLAKDEIGLKNLYKLTSISFIEGLSTRPRISLETLYKHSQGIICLSGCLSGRVNELILDNRELEAMQLVDTYQSLFGKENFWLEIQRNGLNIQEKATEGITRISKNTGIPIVATNDIHYLRHEDCDFQDTMLCINTGAFKSETDRFRFDSDTMYFKTTQEMTHTFRDVPQAVYETLKVAEIVDFKIRQDSLHFPKSGYENPNEALTGITKRELSKRTLGEAYVARLDRELQVINSLGFAEYFLVVKDLVEYARTNGIPVGPGRGSAAGCLVSYLLGITSLDPIRHGLLFERFLNSSRKGLPDVDIDFCQEKRKQVIDYLKDKYGDDKVASIITFNRFGAKKAIRQVAKVFEIPLKESDTIAKKMTSDTIKDSVAQDNSLVEDQKLYPKLFTVAEQLEGYAAYAGVHASGVIISDQPIYEIVPLARIATDSTVVTQWDLEYCEKVGLVKFDILGLETLTIIDRIEKLIKERHNIKLSLTSVPLDKPEVYKLLCNGDTEGVFQCYSDGMRRLLSDMQPSRFDDIVAAIALFRPGPLESGIAKSFIARKNGQEKVTYLHPDLKEIMQNTYGVMVYQEQIMRLASTLGGFSLNEADELRKAVGKKLPEELAKIKDRFLEGCKAVGKITKELATEIWDQIEKFGRYGFNLSHSASYAYITYYTAYLKAFYLPEFLCANLTQEMGNMTKLKAFISDSRKHGVTIVKPSLLTSKKEFSIIDDKTIQIGFGAIKGIGTSLNDFKWDSNCSRVFDTFITTDIYKEISGAKIWKPLVTSGAMDFLGLPRRWLVANNNRSTEFGKRKKLSKPAALFDDTVIEPEEVMRPDTKQELLAFEREAFDFYLSGHPMQEHRVTAFISGARPISGVIKSTERIDNVRIAGLVSSIEIKGIKSGKNKGKKYARIIVEDQSAQIVVNLFSGNYDMHIGLIQEAEEKAIPISIFGRYEYGNDQPHIMIKQVKRLDQEMLDVKEIKLQLSPPDTGKIASLKKILEKYPGDKPLSFIIRTSDKPILIRTNINIDISLELVQELEEFL